MSRPKLSPLYDVGGFLGGGGGQAIEQEFALLAILTLKWNPMIKVTLDHFCDRTQVKIYRFKMNKSSLKINKNGQS